ncbi:dihydrodipicolinate synthase family protein [Streptomyces chromofuscus]|uniref:dihydrodipicolinate synthase family protein n=1 Tax=Streptomyces chromofuscus TaxID=42881 RepID=UPI001991A081|nr:dihydrodipicolinate synthase family protein [Streptomyces chromofuscus]GGT01652.1 hypothetical protein GCM10010254_22440 [Streptomyces chromofuscus]
MFRGLSAFPLTPSGQGIDTAAYTALVARLAAVGVDSIGALGSTGGYAYLTREQRAHVAKTAVEAADGVPVIVGIGALRTSHVLELAEDAQKAGASAVLLAHLRRSSRRSPARPRLLARCWCAGTTATGACSTSAAAPHGHGAQPGPSPGCSSRPAASTHGRMAVLRGGWGTRETPHVTLVRPELVVELGFNAARNRPG